MKETSLRAYESVKTQAQVHREIILETLSRIGRPSTSEVISCHCNLSHPQVWRRLSELEKEGKIVCTELKAVNSSGRTARKWMIKNSQMQLF